MEIPLNTPQFFFDDTLIASHSGLMRRWLPAKLWPRPVLEPVEPWEGHALILFGSILPDPAGGFRMYHASWGGPAFDARVLMAHSDDGRNWTKPSLGVTEFQGSTSNNIVLMPPHPTDGPSVIHESSDPQHPWKMLMFQAARGTPAWSESWGLVAFTSRDGVRWHPYPRNPAGDVGIRLAAGDRTNLMATRPDGRYVIYTRHKEMFSHAGGRAVYRSTSMDFLQWDEPELVLVPDLHDSPAVEFYGMSVFERHGWHLGLLEYWASDIDHIEVHLVFSRDGVHWHRPQPRQPFIAGTSDWNRKWASCAANGPIVLDEQMVFYLGGRWTSHHYDSAHMDGSIGYASLPLDRFCALEAGAARQSGIGGRFTTPSLIWPGGDLVLNADTRASFESHPLLLNGQIEVDVLDAQGQPLPGWKPATFRGNTHCRGMIHDGTVHWPDDRRLADLRGSAVRLRFTLSHARLFTIEARATG